MKTKSCNVCGGAIRADMTQGHCPACLLDRLVDLAPEPAFATPYDLENYELEEIIGRGGMGVVWRARQRKLNRIVAIKFLAGGGWASDEAHARLRAEALAAARLRHPGIVPVIDLGESENGPWLSMEYVPGQTLSARLADGPLSPRASAELLRAVTEAVAHAHQHGVLHRDLKPGNILLDAAGQPRVTDFGLARVVGTDSSLTRTGQMVGSPAYLAPEIMSHAEPSEAGDVYALGATLYHALTGRPPFDAPTVEGILRQVAETEPVVPRRLQPNIPADLETIVLTCLQKVPARRYASAALLAQDLGRFLEGRPIAARRISALEKAWRWCGRRPAIATLLALLVIGTAVAFWRIDASRQSEQRERTRAEASLVELRSRTHALQVAETNLTASNSKLTESLEQLQLERTEDLFEQNRLSEGLLSLARLLAVEPPSRLAAARLAGLMMHQDVARLSGVPEFFFQKMIKVITTPDGARAFAGAESGRLWRLVPEGEKMRRDSIDGSFRHELMRLNADGSILALVRKEERNAVVFVDTVSGEFLPGKISHGAEITGICFSGDGHRVAVFGRDGFARLWDRDSSDAVGPPLTHGRAIRFATLSPDGRRLVTASDDGALAWWEAGRAEVLARHVVSHANLSAFAASADGELIATGDGEGEVLLWNATTTVIHAKLADTRQRVVSLAFRPDGRLLACGTSDGRVRLIRIPGGEVLGEDLPLFDRVREFVFNPDGRRVALCSESLRIVLLDTETGRTELQSLNHAERAPSAAFLARGEKLLTASAEGTIRNWDLRQSRAREIILNEPGPSPALHGGALAPSGRQGVTWSANGVLRRWPAESLEAASQALPSALITNAGRIAFAMFSPDEARLLGGFADGSVRVFTFTNGGFASRALAVGAAPMCGAFSPDGEWIAVGTVDGGVHLWRTADGRPEPVRLRHKAEVRSIAFSPDGQWLVSASHDHTARFLKWRERDASPVVVRHTDDVTCAIISPDGKTVGTSSHDRTVAFWDITTGKARTILKEGAVERIFFSPDGTRMAMVPNNAAVQFWNMQTFAQVSRIRGHAAGVVGACFSPDGLRFATASRDGTARVWDVNSGLPLTPPFRHGAGVTSVAFFPDGLRLFTTSHDGTARVWEAPVVPDRVPGWAAKLPRLLAGELIEEERRDPLTALTLWERMEAELRTAGGNDPLARVARWFGERAEKRVRGPYVVNP